MADQLERAMVSVVLNIAEGAGRNGKDRYHHYRIALGSALEVGGVLDSAIALAYCADVDLVRDKLCEVQAILWKVTRG